MPVKLSTVIFIFFINTTCGLAQSITVPMEILKTGHIVISVKVNDKGPYRLIFDTGAPTTIISSKVATEAEVVKPSLSLTLFGAGGQANVKSFELGNLKTPNNSVVVMDHPTLKVMSKFFGPIEGIIGFTTYSRYKFILDYKASSITFSPTGFIPPDIIKAMMTRMTGSEKSQSFLFPKGIWGFQAEKSSLDTSDGITVSLVNENSPAAKAGLKKNDRILSLDGFWTDSLEDLFFAASKATPQKSSKLTILRDQKKMNISLIPSTGI